MPMTMEHTEGVTAGRSGIQLETREIKALMARAQNQRRQSALQEPPLHPD